MAEKVRLDTKIVELGFAPSREKAKAMIMAGLVTVNGQIADKVGHVLSPLDVICVKRSNVEYVSRGGLKLHKAIQCFSPKISNCICADIGASTGGFTDCMLQNGAKRVYAIDTGYGQLALKLRNNEKVICLERTNARYLTNEHIPEPVDFVSVDVSFISLSLIAPSIFSFLSQNAQGVLLIKPQFEAGREFVGKNGVVRDSKIHTEVINSTLNMLEKLSLAPVGLTFSPIKGPKGNIEFLVYIKKYAVRTVFDDLVDSLVLQAHTELL